MEFYPGFGIDILVLIVFQFPTGWNSTYAVFRINVRKRRVSIPNGMEFYKRRRQLRIRRILFQFPTGWNSTDMMTNRDQRDHLVSIPNGMEFYITFVVGSCTNMCFNSQRDGILPKLGGSSTRASGFQFPTGWNSTSLALDKLFEFIQFQFPTGWNSTVKLFYRSC